MIAKLVKNPNAAKVDELLARLSEMGVKGQLIQGGAAMVMAALMAEGTSEIRNVHLIDRGYDVIERKLSALGADIRRCDDDPDAQTLSSTKAPLQSPT